MRKISLNENGEIINIKSGIGSELIYIAYNASSYD